MVSDVSALLSLVQAVPSEKPAKIRDLGLMRGEARCGAVTLPNEPGQRSAYDNDAFVR